MRNLLFTAALAVSLLATAGVQARTEREQRSDLLMLLNAYEFRVDAAVLRGIGPDVNKLLIEISGTSNHRPRVRNHAVMGLSAFPSVQTRKYLESMLLEPALKKNATGTLLRRQSLRSLGRAFGGEVVVPIANLKDDPDPQIRIAVAHALGDTGSAQAKSILSAWLPHEKELAVREAVDQALTHLRKRRKK